MNGTMARKLKQVGRRDTRDFMMFILTQPWYDRVRFAWYVIWNRR